MSSPKRQDIYNHDTRVLADTEATHKKPEGVRLIAHLPRIAMTFSFSNTRDAGSFRSTIPQNTQSSSFFHCSGTFRSMWASIMKEVMSPARRVSPEVVGRSKVRAQVGTETGPSPLSSGCGMGLGSGSIAHGEDRRLLLQLFLPPPRPRRIDEMSRGERVAVAPSIINVSMRQNYDEYGVDEVRRCFTPRQE